MTLGSEQQFPRVRVGPWSENEPSGAWDCPADVETVDSDLTLSLLSPSAARAAGWEGQRPCGSSRRQMALGPVATPPPAVVLGAAGGTPLPRPSPALA